MKGLELSQRYFYEVALPILERDCCDKLMKLAIGLVGEGSDCFGYDDEISQDHDWGPGFAIWLSDLDYQQFGKELSQIYDSLPKTYLGYSARETSRWGEGRIGVLQINTFFRTLLGMDGLPQTPKQWLATPENGLATAVNGKVFHDPQGTFSAIRRTLLRYYPEDVRLKKITARVMVAGQAGQYNYPRSVKRNEPCAALQAEAKFIETALSLVFLLNRTFMPFYKWAHRAVKPLDILGEYAYNTVLRLVTSHNPQEKEQLIEEFSQKLIEQLREQGLTESTSDFLPDHGPGIQAMISDEELKRLGLIVG